MPEGTLLEACAREVLCPCWIGEDPDNGMCDAIIAYHIDRGMVGEVDVSGLTLVGAGHIPGNVLQGNWKILHLIDDRATHEQIVALSEAFTGRLGGPLADLFGLVGEYLGAFPAKVDFQLVEGAGSITVGDKLHSTMAPYKSAYGTTTTLRDSIFSTIAGAPARVSKASETRVNRRWRRARATRVRARLAADDGGDDAADQPAAGPPVRHDDPSADGSPPPGAAVAGRLSGRLGGVFGIAIHALDAALHALVRQSGWLAEHAPLIGPAVLVLAGVYQFTPLKYHCLDKCRSPLSFITERWRGRREHWRPSDWASITAPSALAAAGR